MFQFKQFTINQDKTAMKVGTDGVLLGAWAPIDHNPFSILDIGAGTGLIALMLAQRSAAEQIDALEIDENAFEQATDNFENSPWSDRLFCFHAGLDEFVEEPEDVYDLIVSNPPFYTEDQVSGNEARDTARFADALPFEDLVEAAALLLSENGIFAVIIPFKEEADFVTLASEAGLHPIKITRVKGMPATGTKRSLLAFSRHEPDPSDSGLAKQRRTGQANPAEDFPIDELVIEMARHDYTPEYIALTKDFYLKM